VIEVDPTIPINIREKERKKKKVEAIFTVKPCIIIHTKLYSIKKIRILELKFFCDKSSSLSIL
jgi:hypothetical protein